MKILIVVGAFPQMSETFIFRQVVSLAERGHEVTVATRDPGNWSNFSDWLPLPDNIRVVYLTPDNRVWQPDRLMRLLKTTMVGIVSRPLAAHQLFRSCRSSSNGIQESIRYFLRYVSFLAIKTDIIHFEFLGLPNMYRLLPTLLDAPFVVSCRGSDLHLFHQFLPQHQQGVRDTLLQAGAVHAVSTEMADQVRRISGREQNIWVNRPAVPNKALSCCAAKITNTPPLVVATGRLVWKKGFDYLLAAAALLKRNGLSFHLKIVGDGSLRSSLRFSVQDMELNEDVELCGALSPSAVAKVMQNADLFVLSSHEEGISNAVLEAMASCLPIVTTNAGGMPEVVHDGVDGFVVPVRDIEALADRIERLLLDPALRARMGKAARQRVESEFLIDRQAEMFERMYQSAVGERVNSHFSDHRA